MTSTFPVGGAPAEAEPQGLTSSEVEERERNGQTNRVDSGTTRSTWAIIGQNVVTRFNILLGSLAALIIVVGSPRDALFGLILVANTAVGVVQELRAKQTLDRLALLDAPTARVRRDGQKQDISVEAVVKDDLILIERGDQIVADGPIISSQGLEVDEALLTGESDPLPRVPSDLVRSGSVVIAGTGCYLAERVGADAYANELASQARRYEPARSEIGHGINQILRLVTWLLVPTAVLLVVSQVRASASLPAAVAGSVAGVVSMVPEGLVLLTSMAMAISVVRLGKRSILTRELPAIEGLARVDIVCIDKTGTLTEGAIQLDQLLPLGNEDEARIRSILGAMGAADPNPNPSLAAIVAGCSDPLWPAMNSIPFSSERKWSAVDLGERGVWYLGAPDVLVDDPEVQKEAAQFLAGGNRVLVLAAGEGPLPTNSRPRNPTATALVVLSERIKADAASTLAYFADQGIDVKVLSGDHPSTVAAVATAVGLDASEPIDASDYLDASELLVEASTTATVIGRVSPAQKQDIVNGLQARGHTIAMTGDGVNDLLALKDARVGIAMGSGSPATRSVAQFVLLDDGFGALPSVVAEGRRVIGNIERVGKLFMAKTVYAFFLSVSIGIAQLPFPLLPRHLSLVAAVTIGIPAFVLALAPNGEMARPGFVDRIVGFAIPAGIIAATATFAAYADIFSDGVTLTQSQTTATTVLFIVGLATLILAARPMTRGRWTLTGAMIALYMGVVLVPAGRSFYALDLPPAFSWVETALVAGAAVIALPWLLGHPAIARWTTGLTVRFRRADEAQQLRRNAAGDLDRAIGSSNGSL